jgi:hypothetical protein
VLHPHRVRLRRVRSPVRNSARDNRKVRSTVNICHNARLLLSAATLLATTAALAQSSAAKQKVSHPSNVSHGAGLGRRSYVPFKAATGSGSSSQQPTQRRDTSGGMATGRRMYQPFSTASHKTPSSGHATQSTSAQPGTTGRHGKMGAAQTNPMYKDKGMSGNNPLFEDKGKTVQPSQHSGEASHEVVEYKDGDDTVTHGKNGQQTAVHKSGSVIVLDRESKANSATKPASPHAAGPAAKQ